MKRFLGRLIATLNLGRIYWRSHGGGLRGAGLLIWRGLYFLVSRGPTGFVRRAKSYRSVALNLSMTLGGGAGQPPRPFDFALIPHRESVDIVVCVHNALDDVRRCLSSILRCTFPPYRLILVDDGSDPPTRDYLRRFATAQAAELIRNETAQGYTLAANQGLRLSDADWVVLLNSDTLVTPHWLDRMLMCAGSDARVGMVGPVSNTASWQSIPEQLIDGDWAANPLPEGMNLEAMADLVAAFSGRVYPRIGFLNGFCLLIRRALMQDIGLFDEATFAAGFGEENDYCLRAQAAGWSLCVADDAYIYHAQSRSYSHARRLKLAKRADQALARKHGQELIAAHLVSCQSDPVLLGVRARAAQMLTRRKRLEAGRHRWEGKRILFIMPVAEPGGGANVIVNEALALSRMGVDVRFVNRASLRPFFERAYPDFEFPVSYLDKPEQLPGLCQGADAVIATVYNTVRWLLPLQNRAGARPVLGYYVQDFEPDFFAADSVEYQEALASYSLIESLIRITKTEWNRTRLKDRTGLNAGVIGPSCDPDLFRPRQPRAARWPERPLRIGAMIRPSTPRRAPENTLRVLSAIRQAYAKRVEILLFGVNPEDPLYRTLIGDQRWDNRGVLCSNELALLFNDLDIFVDFSRFQAMGLTALEAMACGAAVIVPAQGGAASFALHEENALLVDTGRIEQCEAAVKRLIDDHGLRRRLQRNALQSVVRFAPEAAAERLMTALFSGSEDMSFTHISVRKKFSHGGTEARRRRDE